MDIEEAARRAVAHVPRPGTFTTLFGRYAIESGFACVVVLAIAVWSLESFDGTRLGLPVLLALLALTVTALALLVRLLILGYRSFAGYARAAEGDLEGAARVHDELVQKRLVLPVLRAFDATSLASCALFAGHPDRAIVLLRAVEASGASVRYLAPYRRERVVEALLALGRPAEARTVLAAMLADAGRWKVMHLHVELLVEALTGSADVAAGLAERLAAARARTPGGIGRMEVVASKIAFGDLVTAWVWDRIAREGASDQRADAEGRRAAALHLAGRVPDFTYRYLATAMPEFVAFCDRSALP